MTHDDDDDDFLSPSLEASLYDLKAIYRVLVENGDDRPELNGNGFFESLILLLETQAQAEGIDVASDAEWAAWLRDTGPIDSEETSRELLN